MWLSDTCVHIHTVTYLDTLYTHKHTLYHIIDLMHMQTRIQMSSIDVEETMKIMEFLLISLTAGIPFWKHSIEW